MGRGREREVNCASCGRTVRRDKAVQYDSRVVYSTDLRTADDVTVFETRKAWYCPSCGKHRKIYEKIKRQKKREY